MKLKYLLLTIIAIVLAYFLYLIADFFINVQPFLATYVRAKEISVSLEKDSWILTNAMTGATESFEMKGRKAIVAFATWCKPCLEKMKQYKDSVKQSDQVLFVSDEDLEDIKQFQQKHNIPFPLYKDTSDFTGRFVDMLPSVFIIKDDSLLYKMEGPLSYAAILERMKMDYW